jgi:hypothetical protein
MRRGPRQKEKFAWVQGSRFARYPKFTRRFQQAEHPMRNTVLLRSLLLLLLSISGLVSSAQDIATSKLDNQQSILNGRAFATFPTAAINSARPSDIMSADHNINLETRLLLDIQKMRLVFFAQELYALGDKKSVTQFVTQDNVKTGSKTTVVTDNSSLFTILSTPIVFDSTKEAILVNSLLVRTTDNTVFRIAAYINPDAYNKRDEFIKLTARVFATLTAGARQNSRAAHTESLAIANTKKKFKIALPANYAVTADQKYDFQVFVFHHYRNLGDEQRENLTIYAGSHPSYFFRSFHFERDEAQLLKGTFLGKPINWLHFNNPEKHVYIKEQQIPSDNLAAGLVLHVGMLGSNDSTLDELTKIAAAIELAN